MEATPEPAAPPVPDAPTAPDEPTEEELARQRALADAAEEINLEIAADEADWVLNDRLDYLLKKE